ncbi:hypothetical protein HanHA300_Chr06g0202771 [Helianthus annuus]|nr:hypothetical protein HanHA300_Chr06g0202771 [Helianthus annuus]KAJ0565707.1 hypothetical protein HanIR_Chr06g0265591 [Helianthus annuus]
MLCWYFVHPIVVPFLHYCLHHGWLLCDLFITQQERETQYRDKQKREKTTQSRRFYRRLAKLRSVVVMFADVAARVPVTLDGAMAYTQWQEAIGATILNPHLAIWPFRPFMPT